MRYICHKNWLGGWFMPQKRSYFALQLPKGWWVFGLDLALHGDIDVYQFKFFAELCQNKVLFCYGEVPNFVLAAIMQGWLLSSHFRFGANIDYKIVQWVDYSSYHARFDCGQQVKIMVHCNPIIPWVEQGQLDPNLSITKIIQ